VVRYIHIIGAANHMTSTRPPTMFIAAQNGVTNGEPMYAIWAQSKVTGNRPRPDAVPNCKSLVILQSIERIVHTRLATITLRGANHVITLNELKAGNKRPGRK
jgi:hypothetical protein